MANNLFPVFDMPSAFTKQVQVQKKHKRSPCFDFTSGEFVLNGARQPIYGTEHDAWVLWCTKTILTQRFAYLSYSTNIGIEAEEAFRQPDRKSRESFLERTITEALLADPMKRTKQVRDFIFQWDTDSLFVKCSIYGINGKTANIQTTIST